MSVKLQIHLPFVYKYSILFIDIDENFVSSYETYYINYKIEVKISLCYLIVSKSELFVDKILFTSIFDIIENYKLTISLIVCK